MYYKLRLLLAILKNFIRQPRAFVRFASLFPAFIRGLAIEERLALRAPDEGDATSPSNPLWDYFSKHEKGPGIWKWTHYFNAYDRHFARFRDQEVNLLEIGIYSGGSLDMWLEYFGDRCRIYGVDIEDACRSYETDRIRVFIGDQESREFWARFRTDTPQIHILIDDGGHTPEQQMVTLEEMLPCMPVGSVYVCEDIHGISNRFAAFAAGLVQSLNACNGMVSGVLGFTSTRAQQEINSIHFYPYLCVIEKHENPPSTLTAPKHGTEWQPFL
ncbi:MULTISPECIES: class I SAM-dependent methyltransferase [Aphanothece]|uniref:class I SAM-dependent methyltransferase n=1 Tax=Aphanothece TaxID=1121 RepID=UPI003984F7B2